MLPIENFCVELLNPTVTGGGHAWVLMLPIYAPEDTPRYQRNSVPYRYDTLVQYYTANPQASPCTTSKRQCYNDASGLGYIKVPTHIG